MSNYITWLRSRIGSRKTLLAYTTALIRDEQGRVLVSASRRFQRCVVGIARRRAGDRRIVYRTARRREALEETGYHVEPVRLIGLYCSPEFDVRYPNGDEVQQFTVALECRIAGGQRADRSKRRSYISASSI